MPLPVLPADNTARYKVFYTVGGRQHTQEVRVGAVSPAVFGPAMEAYYEDLDNAINDTVIDDVQFAGSGSSIFNSVATSLTGNHYGAGAGSIGEIPYFYSFVGRTSGARRMRFYQFGANVLGGNYRFTAGEDARLDAALADIVGFASAFLAIDGLKPVMKSYINAGANAYWQRAVR